eukprot:Phypoly_transcript_07930.p1 GENE.Phypoly_transcript_07930~~Phypoly_transcript_07930.p1  ORF type:complete len:494 (+),score=64.19 Phypoly_transcript_07930:61-1542(+)
MLAVFLVGLLLSHACVLPVLGYGEPDSSGHPTYMERANHVFLNAVRIAPSQYKQVYMAGYSPSPSGILGSTYPAVPPVYLEPALVSSSFFHSNDMATHNCFSHPSCDGTDTFQRIESYYSCSGNMGENIAAGINDPLGTNNQWLCDQSGSACAADGSGGDGHRENMMNHVYQAAGVGYAYNSGSTYKSYWTQDFGGAECKSVSNPVYSGSHYISSGNTKFIAVYYTSPAVAPSSANVVIGGTSHSLSLDIGAKGAGTYAYTQPEGSGCQSYYFTFGNVRYPDTGCLVTYGEGSCTTSFDSTCGGTNGGAATTSASSSHATTASTASSTTSRTTSTHSTTSSATSTTGSTTGGGGYYIYSSSNQNGWNLQYNSGLAATNSYTYNGRTGLKVVFGGSDSTDFILINHSPAVTNVWSTLQFYAAASTSGSFLVYWNGGYYQTKSVTTSWQLFSISLSDLADPSTGKPYTALGSPNQLVFEANGNAYTLYLSGIELV